MATLYNTDDVPVHIDDEGRVLGSREHGTGDLDSEAVKAAVAAGRLLVLDDPAAAEAEPPKSRKTKTSAGVSSADTEEN